LTGWHRQHASGQQRGFASLEALVETLKQEMDNDDEE